MLTLRDLLGELDVRLLAGEAGLDAPVRWVHISELSDPTPWLSGGELLLTTGMQLDGVNAQRDFIARLADHHLAGLGFGTGFTHATVPPALIEVAADREFPVFEVPYEVPFIAITETAFTQLVNEQYAVLQRALSAHERLQRIVLTERGLDAVAAALSTLVGASVIAFDFKGEPMVRRAFRRELGSEVLATLQEDVRARVARGDARPFVPVLPDGSHALGLPVPPDGAPQDGASAAPTAEAWLLAVKDAGPLSDFDRLTLHQAVTIVALELLRARVAGDTERRLAGDLLEGMVRGELAGAELARRLTPFGLDDDVSAIVVARASTGIGSATRIEAAIREEVATALVATTGSLSCALVPGSSDEDLYALAQRIAIRAGSEIGHPVSVGIGRPVQAGNARRTFHEARCAVEALALGISRPRGAAGRNGRARVATYRELGSFQLLLSLQDDEALKLFCDTILGPIEEAEPEYSDDLMRSLEAYIEENGQWERAAQRVYCHRHTLRYRIRRVEELTGRNLSNARDRAEFWLALRGRELV